MNKIIKTVFDKIKKPKIIIIIGFIGIGLILISTLFESDAKEKSISESNNKIDTAAYCSELEEKIKSIVYGITGDKKSTVVVTLESGVRYSYADALQSDSSESSGKETAQSSEKTSQSYITVKTADGGEKALVVTEYMPDVKGVAIICSGGDREDISQKIENAVTSALNITSKRVYIAGGTVK